MRINRRYYRARMRDMKDSGSPFRRWVRAKLNNLLLYI